MLIDAIDAQMMFSFVVLALYMTVLGFIFL